MIDVTNNNPLKILGNQPRGGHIIVPVVQLEAVLKVLEENEIEHWKGLEYYSVNDGPEVCYVTIGRNADKEKAQRVLDEAEFEEDQP